MTRTLKTGLQLLATSAGCGLVAALCLAPIAGKIKQGTLHDAEALLFSASVVFGLLTLATGLVAVIYLISSGIEGLGFLIGRRRQNRRSDQLSGDVR